MKPTTITILFAILTIAAMFVGVGKYGFGTPEREAYTLACEHLRAKLKAPATAVFPPYDRKFVTQPEEHKLLVVAYVDAQNSYGALIRTAWAGAIEKHARRVRVIETALSEPNKPAE